ncbi:ABC transporter ATP-binding protein [Enterococcus sp. RIT-PI-f]|uniref:ABC transporter ATP-binding protein n=1 Tax=Enterococcus sp. RIT-PI-f TaxID=1690244 RepID=UPI0006BA0BB2|nr:ABC transporter ATP-binding protein [Enterococcus sp. RIT-PI-f]KPG69772.1 ABC transporter ATP-binding protein [Enterococcus sp. RIT-PI-f]
MTPIIEFKQVSKAFDDKIVIDHLDLTIQKGEIFVLVGPSGSGKTTTLKMINALSEPTDGDIYFKEKRIKDYNIQKMRWQMGYVLQQIALFPTMDVKQNIEVIPEMLGWSKKDRSEAVDRLLKQVQLDPEQYRHRLPKALSGGEQQRIGILRALAANPEVILMDEPFSALDPISRNALQELVLDLHKELGTTIIFVTHNMKEAIKLGSRIAVMNKGKIVQCDTPEVIIAQPKTAFVKTFFEETGEDEAKLVKVADLVAMGYYRKEIDENLEKIKGNMILSDTYALFAQHAALTIVENGQAVGTLNHQDVFAFLSRETQVNEA